MGKTANAALYCYSFFVSQDGTALHCAGGYGNVEIMEILLRHGASTSSVDAVSFLLILSYMFDYISH